MNIENAVVLVTGANRGIGLAFTRALLARGARKVYAAARDPATVTLSGVQALRLDVTRPEEVAAAARTAASSRPTSSACSTSARPSRPCSRPTEAAHS